MKLSSNKKYNFYCKTQTVLKKIAMLVCSSSMAEK
jgi:hypothetical protein